MLVGDLVLTLALFLVCTGLDSSGVLIAAVAYLLARPVAFSYWPGLGGTSVYREGWRPDDPK